MKPFAFFLTAILATAAMPIATHADDLSAQQSAIDAAYKAECATVVAGDTAGWSALMTPDYASTNPDGSVDDLDKSVANLKDAFTQFAFSSCTEATSSIKQSGDDFVTTISMTIDGKAVANGANAEIVQNAVDTWTDASGAWLQKADFVTEQKVTIDGKVVQDSVSTGTPPR